MPISVEEVKHIAALARLELDEAEVARYCQQLSAILDHMAKLRQLDTGDLPAGLGPAEAGSALRPDESRPGLDREALLANAPETEDGQFKIPPVFEED
jgi:aspartyl-tRNA(Asn)/glutamyl-tRNA(Gln) amidotransferase subunit C